MGELSVVEFLEARIAEDEAAADEAECWADDGYEPHIRWVGQGRDSLVHRLGKAGPHIARHNPARVLAECAAKRAIIREHEGMVEAVDLLSAALPMDLNQDPDAHWRTATLRALAAVYKDHPDYVKVFPNRPQTAPAP